MNNLTNKTVLALSLIASIILSHVRTQPFIQGTSFVYATPQIIITTALAILGLTLFLNYLLIDFVKGKKILPFVVPIVILVIISLFATQFFWYYPTYFSANMVFFPEEFAGSLILVASLVLIIFSVYKTSLSLKVSNKKTV